MFLVARGLTKPWLTALACEGSTGPPGRDGFADQKAERGMHWWSGRAEQGKGV